MLSGSASPPRVIVDTSTLIGVLTGKPGGFPAQAVNIALLWYQRVLSQDTRGELERVIHRPALDKYRPLEVRLQFFEKFVQGCELQSVTQQVQGCRDPNDDKFLSLAVSTETTLVVSSDPDLTSMNPYRGIEIVTPRAFVERHAHLPTLADGLGFLHPT
jgi:putative PIN family toxin of toxin-antitoxin system